MVVSGYENYFECVWAQCHYTWTYSIFIQNHSPFSLPTLDYLSKSSHIDEQAIIGERESAFNFWTHTWTQTQNLHKATNKPLKVHKTRERRHVLELHTTKLILLINANTVCRFFSNRIPRWHTTTFAKMCSALNMTFHFQCDESTRLPISTVTFNISFLTLDVIRLPKFWTHQQPFDSMTYMCQDGKSLNQSRLWKNMYSISFSTFKVYVTTFSCVVKSVDAWFNLCANLMLLF